MEEVSDRCCRPRRPTSRREGGRESPPTREGSGVLGATDPDHAGGAKQPNQRRLHGARRARGTSLCPGHILLFGHVKILFLSLLSKSLTIKGRGGQGLAA